MFPRFHSKTLIRNFFSFFPKIFFEASKPETKLFLLTRGFLQSVKTLNLVDAELINQAPKAQRNGQNMFPCPKKPKDDLSLKVFCIDLA